MTTDYTDLIARMRSMAQMLHNDQVELARITAQPLELSDAQI
jgi:hypothetical protein